MISTDIEKAIDLTFAPPMETLVGYLFVPGASMKAVVCFSETKPELVRGHAGIKGYECGTSGGKVWSIDRAKFVEFFGEEVVPKDCQTLVPAKIVVSGWL